jgi:iron complex transport system substrate-binding protein
VKRLLTFSLLLVLAGVPREAAAQQATAETRYPLTVTDDSGTVLTLPAMPRRIISLTLPTDEILLSLVTSSRILAVTTLASDPGISNVSTLAARVPRAMTLAVEPIVALRPDLVFAASWSDASLVGQLRSAGVPVYLMTSATSVAAAEREVARCALLTGEVEKGAQIVTRMRAEIAAVERRVGGIPPQKRLTIIDYTSFGASMGRGSSWDDIVRLAGLMNAVGGIASDEWGQVPVSREKLLEINPDIIIVPDWIYGDRRGADVFRQRVMSDPALRVLSAVRAGRVYAMPERLRSSTSQFMADAVAWLARIAYPTLFK